MSSAGKSFIVTALCRIFSNLGYRVAPFKSQNMALNSGVTFDGKEMGRAQIVQAEAARTIPDVRMNPILLKPNSDIGSQVIVMGKPVGNMNARDYYEYKQQLIPVIKEAFHSLENEYDVIIVEGAGSPAEINLKENDIVNMGLAKMLDIPVLLVGDIDLGGVFAQLFGTLLWLDDEEKDYIKGLIINKFRGDVTLLESGIRMLEDRCQKDVIGVVPYCNAGIDEEDSVTVDLKVIAILDRVNKLDDYNEDHEDNLKDNCKSDYTGDSLKNEEFTLLIDVIRLPHMSNFTDFTPLKRVQGVTLRYITEIPEKNADMIIIPGTKSTISDMNWMKKSGISEYVKSLNGRVPIMGICGGNQILGKSISDPEGIEGGGFSEGLGLLNHTTILGSEKILRKAFGTVICDEGFFKCLDKAEYEGYEIHCGQTDEKGYSGDVFGTYIHGIFDKADVTKPLIKALIHRKYLSRYNSNGIHLLSDVLVAEKKILGGISDYRDVKESEYDKVALTVKNSINMEMLYKIMGIEN